MRKVADFKTFKTLKNMSFNDFNRWVISVYQSGYKDGADEEAEKYGDNPTVFDEDTLYEFLLTVPGVGEKTASRIVNTMIERYCDG